MRASSTRRRRIGVTAVALIGMGAALMVPAGPASAFTKPPQAYGGYGSGVETFANLAPTAQLAKAQVAVAHSAANSQGLTNITDELGDSVSVANGGQAAHGFGEALELNVVGQPIQLVAPASAEAPPTGPEVVNSLLNLPVSGLASVAAVRGRASARFNDAGNVCIIGADLARGVGEAADARLLGTAGGALGLTNPLIAAQTGGNNAVSSSSRQLLTGQVRADGSVAGSKLGVLSEVTQTVVPVNIADPTGNLAISVEVAGVFQLKAFAGGLPGTGFIEYNPSTTGQAPVLRLTVPPTGVLGNLLGPIFTALAPATQGLLQFNNTTGQLLVPLGPVLQLLQPLVDLLAQVGIVIGERPRAIGGVVGSAPLQAGDGTASAAAIDLVRIKPAGALAALAGLVGDVRIGHMEVLSFAPAGGIDCPGLGVGKATDRDPVQVGESFVYTITATNPYDCTLTNVRVQDDITPSNGVSFSVGTTNPAASGSSDLANGGKRVVFNDIGPIGPRGSKSVQIQLTVNSATRQGRISDTATITASCATGGGTGTTNVNFNLSGSVTLNAPQVGGVGVSGDLPRTGRNDGTFLLIGLSFLMALAGLEAIRRRTRSHT